MSPFTAELVGTMILLLLGNGVVANVVLNNTKGNNGGWIVITFGWGLAVFTAVVVAQDGSGAHLNPAVTIGLALVGKFSWSLVASYISAQMLGAALGTSLVWLMYKDHYALTEDKAGKRATFCTEPAVKNISTNVLSEVLGTFILVFAVLYITGPNFAPADDTMQPGLGSLGALPVALIVLAIGLSLGGTTGYAINPARDLAPRIMHAILPVANKGDSDWNYSWVPVIGPILGAGVAALLFLNL
ncbi:MAG: aquaporin family protein [Saprospiraceae bacterium]|nr:aquaporin family protein [Saprospiraceae bacterium]